MSKYIGVIKIIAAFGPAIKKWVYSDGKFKIDRALILMTSAILLTFGVEHYGAATIDIVLTFLDQLSDIFGYAE